MRTRERPARRCTALLAAALLLAAASLAACGSRTDRVGARLPVAGGDGGGLPRADPALEHLDAAALERAAHDPAAAGLQVFAVTRHGHLVFARYAAGVDGKTVVDAGAFAQVLPALLAWIAVQDRSLQPAGLADLAPAQLRSAIEQATHERYADFLSERLWSRLNAGPAWIDLPSPGAAAPVDCCFHARIEDWLRVGGLLVNDGNFEDTPVLQPGWIERMRLLRPRRAPGAPLADQRGFGVDLPAPHGGGYQAADVFLLRGPGHWRLWAIPSLRLVVLFGARGGKAVWDETRLPNLVIDALTDQSASPHPESLLQQLVPGH